ncbi:MAG: hypothetical protein ACI4V5_05205 [Prevotella sp.]
MKLSRLFFYILLSLLSVNTFAQSNRKKPGAKQSKQQKTVVAEPEKSGADILFEDMLPVTARLTVVDSTVTDFATFMTSMPLNRESGRIGHPSDFGLTGSDKSATAHINEFGNKAFFTRMGKDSLQYLYMADKLGGKWTNERKIDFGPAYKDIRYPFMMSDGVTLYFSAISDEGLGGHDLYVTMYDTDSARFYKPENLGLPYNSKADDYCCLVDDYDRLAWLVTTRGQSAGKVCIYTFVPSESREVYDISSLGENKLRNLANLSSIKDTWHDPKSVSEAKKRIAELKQRMQTAERNGIRFVVNDKVVYTDIADFKSPTNRDKYVSLVEMREQHALQSKKLDDMRQEYMAASLADKRTLGTSIQQLEKRLQEEDIKIKAFEKEIRNAENLMYNK